MSTSMGWVWLNLWYFQHQGHDVYKYGMSVTAPLTLSTSGAWCLQVQGECDCTFYTFNIRGMMSTSTGWVWLNLWHFKHQGHDVYRARVNVTAHFTLSTSGTWCLQVRGECDWTFDTFIVRDMMSTSTGWVWLHLWHFQHQGHDVYKYGVSVTEPLTL